MEGWTPIEGYFGDRVISEDGAMAQGEKEAKFLCSCPLCKAMAAARESSAVKHVRGIEREMLLAARGMLDWCIERIDKEQAETSKKPGTKEPS
jgi:hypothetical protein